MGNILETLYSVPIKELYKNLFHKSSSLDIDQSAAFVILLFVDLCAYVMGQ